ncbi:MAG: hypothetical protein ACO3MF_04410 [Acholeplasmataceae bacterium]
MEQWSIILYFLLIGGLMFVGKFLKTKVPVLNKIVIPTALLAGILGLVISLIFAPMLSEPVNLTLDAQGRYIEVIETIDVNNVTAVTEAELEEVLGEEAVIALLDLVRADYYNREIVALYESEDGMYYMALSKQVTLFNVHTLEYIVYHALAIGFLALALKRNPQKEKKTFWSTGMLITSTYALQAFLGISLVFLFFGDRFIGSGMLVALGFGQGPGLAMSIGSGWNEYLSGYGTVLGASYAFLGFLFGGTIGVILINVISRRRGIENNKVYEETSSKATIEIDTVKEISILDGITQQFVVIGVIYGLVYLTLFGVRLALNPLGGAGDTIFGLFVGFNFIIAILYGLLYKTILIAVEKRGKNVRFMTNNYVLSNIASFAFNIMIAGSVLSITLAFLQEFGVQLIVTALLAGIVTLFYLRFMSLRIYNEFHDEFTIGLFGMLTGVASTGLALLKGIDPNLETPVAEEMVLGSGTAILMALPLFVLLFIPSFTAGTDNETLFTWITYLGIFLYVVIFAGILIFKSRKK